MLLALLASMAVQDADAIMARVAERARDDARARYERRLTGTKSEVSHDIGGGRERVTEAKEWALEAASDGFLQRLTSLNGAPVTGASLQRPQLDPTVFVATMGTRFRFRMASPVPLNGYWAIAFSPRNAAAPAADDREAIVNRLSGVAYVDAERLFVRRVHAWLERPFSRHGVGRVQEATVLLEQDVVGNVPVPVRSVFEVRYSKGLGLILNSHVRVTVRYAFDPPPAAASEEPSAPPP